MFGKSNSQKKKNPTVNRTNRIIEYKQKKKLKLLTEKISVHSANIYQGLTMCQACSKYERYSNE